MDVLVSEGFQECFRISAVGFIAWDVGTHCMWREQDHRVSETVELSGPVMGGTTGFEQDSGRLVFRKVAHELNTSEAAVFTDMTWSPGDGDLKNRLCMINSYCGSIHRGLLLSKWFFTGAIMTPIIGGVHSITCSWQSYLTRRMQGTRRANIHYS